MTIPYKDTKKISGENLNSDLPAINSTGAQLTIDVETNQYFTVITIDKVDTTGTNANRVAIKGKDNKVIPVIFGSVGQRIFVIGKGYVTTGEDAEGNTITTDIATGAKVYYGGGIL